jgi:CDP-glucose 4,6-dehydratase
MGTVHVLEAMRQTPSVRVAVIITSDKCYENRELIYAYRENDPMGGRDPYSASKGAAELVTASYRNSFFQHVRSEKHCVGLATARAGNVIGGGDWAEDRLIPDCIRALVDNQRIAVRNPYSIRPWQHVLEPLFGYLSLAQRMWEDPSDFAGAWNFGPSVDGNATVGSVVNQVIREWGSGEWEDVSLDQANAPHEASALRLDCTKAATVLDWRPILSLNQSIRKTMSWYRSYYFDPHFDAHSFTVEQIENYTSLATPPNLKRREGQAK